jgi:hypothetical protein
MASRKIGRVPAAWTMATAAGDADRSVISQELATSRMKLPVLPSTVAIQRTAKTGCARGAKLPPEDFDRAHLLALGEVVRCDEDESTRKAEMLEEGIGRHHTIHPGRHFPKAKGEECRQDGEACERQCSGPTKTPETTNGRGRKLKRDDGDGEEGCGMEAEMIHLGQCAIEVEDLRQRALNIGCAERKQRDGARRSANRRYGPKCFGQNLM